MVNLPFSMDIMDGYGWWIPSSDDGKAARGGATETGGRAARGLQFWVEFFWGCFGW